MKDIRFYGDKFLKKEMKQNRKEMEVVEAFHSGRKQFDPLGSYTGMSEGGEPPSQDGDDL